MPVAIDFDFNGYPQKKLDHIEEQSDFRLTGRQAKAYRMWARHHYETRGGMAPSLAESPDGWYQVVEHPDGDFRVVGHGSRVDSFIRVKEEPHVWGQNLDEYEPFSPADAEAWLKTALRRKFSG
jgi:hypothetical protein